MRYITVFLSCSMVCAQYDEEVAIGMQMRRSITSARALAPENPHLVQTMRKMLKTPTAFAGPPLPYALTILEDPAVNAFTTPGGQIYLNSGLGAVLGSDQDMWAAIIGHEMGHSIGRHLWKRYRRAVGLQSLRQVALALAAPRLSYDAQRSLDQLATFGLTLASLKLGREDEHEADRIGLRMLAEAGFSISRAIEAFEKLDRTCDDPGKVATFFNSNHPRWETRRDHLIRYSEQMERQGIGAAHVFAAFGMIRAIPDKRSRELIVHVPIRFGDPSGVVSLSARFYWKGTLLPIQCSQEIKDPSGSTIVELRVPSASFVGALKGEAFVVVSSDGKPVGQSQVFIYDAGGLK